MSYVMDLLQREELLLRAQTLELNMKKEQVPAENLELRQDIARQIAICDRRAKEIGECLKTLQS